MFETFFQNHTQASTPDVPPDTPMQPDDSLLKHEMERDEGRKSVLYLDTKGISTAGIGHNCISSPLPEGMSFPLDDGEIDQLYAFDMGKVFDSLDEEFPWWRNMSYARQRVVANMCFNLGLHKLEEFQNTMAAMEQGRYKAAENGMLASLWAKQVGERAIRLADMMEAG